MLLLHLPGALRGHLHVPAKGQLLLSWQDQACHGEAPDPCPASHRLQHLSHHRVQELFQRTDFCYYEILLVKEWQIFMQAFF